MKYRAEIDGLRALAVLPVILYHAGYQSFSGGFVGVDIFFVISGYLISSIIFDELSGPGFSLTRFYERRARRILPALFLVMVCCLPLAWFVSAPLDFEEFAESLVAVSIFVSNIFFWQISNYFDTSAELKPLLHTWSLALEEQFYIIFPLMVLALWRWQIRLLVPAVLLILIMSLILAEVGSSSRPVASFFLLPTRAWELMLGVIAALFLKSSGHLHSLALNQLLSILGLLLLVISVLVFDNRTPFPGLYALLPTMGTVLIVICAVPGTLVQRLLQIRVLVVVGLISYSAYLWHQPLFAFARQAHTSELLAWQKLTVISLTFLLGFLSWKFIERPFRNATVVKRKTIFVVSLTGIVMFSCLGLFGKSFSHSSSRFTESASDILAFEQYHVNELYRQGECFLRTSQSAEAFSEACTGSSLFLWGDSHSASLSVGLREFLDISQYGAGECPPLLDVDFARRPNCRRVNDYIYAKLLEVRPEIVVLHADWSNPEYGDFDSALSSTLTRLTSDLPKARIVVLGSLPKWRPSLPRLLVKNEMSLLARGKGQYLAINLKDQKNTDRRIMDTVAGVASDNLQFVSLVDRFCGQFACIVVVNERRAEPLVWDHSHLTREGAWFLARKVLSTLDAR